ncbi:MAG: SAM-dependent methyltransferase [Crocinitomicaceae bacterium]|nr:SAM-dependent methyltransferase [Crocinitomicaceae bacterium]
MNSSKKLTQEYWNIRYLEGATGWDMGKVSPPIKGYVDQLEDKTILILIPGAGNSHEVEYLHRQGFTNVHLLDYAETPMKLFCDRNPDFPKKHVHIEDLFAHEGRYDLILEQTLFCAINPILRQKYADKVSGLLAENGKLVGVLFGCKFEEGPPFGGTRDEYLSYFSSLFRGIEMNPCYNSIEPRSGKELFINLEK